MPSLSSIIIGALIAVFLGFCGGFYVEYEIKDNEIASIQLKNDNAYQQALAAARLNEQGWQDKFNQQEAFYNEKIHTIDSNYTTITNSLQQQATAASSKPKNTGLCVGATASGNTIPWQNIKRVIDLAKVADNQAVTLIKCENDMKALVTK